MPSFRPTAAIAALLVTTPGLLGDPRGPADDFRKLVTAAATAHEAGDLLTTEERLVAALAAVREEFRVGALELMPRRPIGFERVDPQPQPAQPAPGGVALAPQLALSGNAPAEQFYRAFEGNAWIRAALHPNSPEVHRIRQDMTTAEQREDCEIVEYQARVALLRTARHGLRLSFVLQDRHVLDVRAQGVEIETLKEMFSDAVLRKFDDFVRTR